MSKQQQTAMWHVRQPQDLPPRRSAVEEREKGRSTFETLKSSKSLMRVVVFGPAEEIIRRANETANQPRPPTPKTTTTNAPRPVGGSMERCVEVLIAVTLIILLWPLMTIVALLIKINMGGPVIFAHPRVGVNGKAFKCYKFRTMISNAEQALLQHLADNPESKREWETTAKLRNDPRVTKLGRLLRRSSIDELPQLLNVLKGDMSLVGPRPLLPEYLPYYSAIEKRRFEALPGLTGLAQIRGRNATTWEQRFKFDVEYVENNSFFGDLKILFLTVWRVVSREGISADGHETMPRFDDYVRSDRRKGGTP